MQSSVWGGGEKSIKSNKTIKLPALARLILAAGWRKLRSCAMEAAAFRHPFLVSFLSVCCWWRREDTFPKQDICFDPCTAVLMYSAGSSSDLKKKKKKSSEKTRKPQIHTLITDCVPALLTREDLCFVLSEKLMLSIPWKWTLLCCLAWDPSAGILDVLTEPVGLYCRRNQFNKLEDTFFGRF